MIFMLYGVDLYTMEMAYTNDVHISLEVNRD